MQGKKIIVASDHAGCSGRELVINHLKQRGYMVFDYGTDNPKMSVDYPDKAAMLARGILKGEAPIGILLCGSGIGMSIAVNRFPEMRGALCCSAEMARLSRAHNDANVLVMGGRLTDDETLLACVDAFLDTPFEGGRHVPRVRKLGKLPNDL